MLRGKERTSSVPRSANRPKFPFNGVDVATGKAFKFTTSVAAKINAAQSVSA